MKKNEFDETLRMLGLTRKQLSEILEIPISTVNGWVIKDKDAPRLVERLLTYMLQKYAYDKLFLGFGHMERHNAAYLIGNIISGINEYGGETEIPPEVVNYLKRLQSEYSDPEAHNISPTKAKLALNALTAALSSIEGKAEIPTSNNIEDIQEKKHSNTEEQKNLSVTDEQIKEVFSAIKELRKEVEELKKDRQRTPSE